MDRLKEVGTEGQWGLFARGIPGRVGYQVSFIGNGTFTSIKIIQYSVPITIDFWLKQGNYRTVIM